MKRKRRRPKPERDNPAFLAFVRTFPCCAPTPEPCPAQAVAHHHSLYGRGMSQKAPDNASMPLCPTHHNGDHGIHSSLKRGCFAGWTKEQSRDWQDEQVAHYRAAYAAHCAALEEHACVF